MPQLLGRLGDDHVDEARTPVDTPAVCRFGARRYFQPASIYISTSLSRSQRRSGGSAAESP